MKSESGIQPSNQCQATNSVGMSRADCKNPTIDEAVGLNRQPFAGGGAGTTSLLGTLWRRRPRRQTLP